MNRAQGSTEIARKAEGQHRDRRGAHASHSEFRLDQAWCEEVDQQRGGERHRSGGESEHARYPGKGRPDDRPKAALLGHGLHEDRHHQKCHRALDEQRRGRFRHGPCHEERVGLAGRAEEPGQQEVPHQAEDVSEDSQGGGQHRRPNNQAAGRLAHLAVSDAHVDAVRARLGKRPRRPPQREPDGH